MHCLHYFYFSGSGSMGFPCPEVGNLMRSLVLGLMRSPRPALSWSLLTLVGWALVILLPFSRGWVPSGKMTLPTAYSVSACIDTCSLVLRSLHCVFLVFAPSGWFFSAPLPLVMMISSDSKCLNSSHMVWAFSVCLAVPLCSGYDSKRNPDVLFYWKKRGLIRKMMIS